MFLIISFICVILLHMFDVLNTLIVTEDHLFFYNVFDYTMKYDKMQVFFDS